MPPTPDAVARQWFKEVWDEGKEEAIDRLMAPDAVAYGLTGPGGPPIVGPAGFRPVFHMFREALGDLAIEIERSFVDGEYCTVHCRVKGRHVGRAFGGEPTDRPVDFYGMTTVRVRDGRILEGWNAFDFLAMYQQMGWVGNPVTPQAEGRSFGSVRNRQPAIRNPVTGPAAQRVERLPARPPRAGRRT